MAWPHDARYATKSANQNLEAALVNDVQDKIIGLHEEHSTKDIWIDLAPGMDAGAVDDWLFEDNSSDPRLASQGVSKEIVFDTGDWPEGMSLNSIKIDWEGTSPISVQHRRIYPYRSIWPAASGSAKTNQALNSGYSFVEASAAARAIDTFVCNQNNTLWSHEDDKLVIRVIMGDAGNPEFIYGIKLNVTFYGTNKWAYVAP